MIGAVFLANMALCSWISSRCSPASTTVSHVSLLLKVVGQCVLNSSFLLRTIPAILCHHLCFGQVALEMRISRHPTPLSRHERVPPEIPSLRCWALAAVADEDEVLALVIPTRAPTPRATARGRPLKDVVAAVLLPGLLEGHAAAAAWYLPGRRRVRLVRGRNTVSWRRRRAGFFRRGGQGAVQGRRRRWGWHHRRLGHRWHAVRSAILGALTSRGTGRFQPLARKRRSAIRNVRKGR